MTTIMYWQFIQTFSINISYFIFNVRTAGHRNKNGYKEGRGKILKNTFNVF